MHGTACASSLALSEQGVEALLLLLAEILLSSFTVCNSCVGTTSGGWDFVEFASWSIGLSSSSSSAFIKKVLVLQIVVHNSKFFC